MLITQISYCREMRQNFWDGLLVNPTGPRSGESRVVRGGSSWGPPEVLRSADRDFVRPEGRVRDDGFRCVRVPARQH